MAVMITGGSGLVGIHTARKFAENEQNVICYDWTGKPWYAEQILGRCASKVTFAKGDIQDLLLLKETVNQHKVTGIVHTAAVVNEKNARDNPVKAASVNIIGTVNVLEAARSFKLDRVIYTSSGTIYGRRADGNSINEEEVKPESFYSETKYAGERLLEKYRTIFSIDAVTVRISTAYGPGKPWDPEKYPIQRLCWEALQARRYRMSEGGAYRRDFTYIEDVASGIFLAYHKRNPAYTVYNICSGKAHSLFEVVSILNNIVPDAKLEIGDNRFVKDFALSGSLRGPLDIQRAKEDLKFAPGYSLEAGLSAYVDFIEENRNRLAG